MNKKTVIVSILALVLMLNVAGSGAKAFGGGFEEKFFCKAGMMLKNQEELGLSDEQAGKIKDLKIKTKKDLIRKNAEIEIIVLDLKSAMCGDQIDTGAMDKLIDKKYDFKKEKAKSLMGAYAEVKEILTSEQKNKLKDLYKKCDKKKMKCEKGMKQCPMKGTKS